MEIKLPPVPKRPPKRMIEWNKLPDGRWKVAINSSSLEIITACLRKVEYSLIANWQSDGSPAYFPFGQGIHKAMEIWYRADMDQRPKSSGACDVTQSKMLAYFFDPTKPFSSGDHRCLRCASVWAFLSETYLQLGDQQIDSRHSLPNGVDILCNYFDQYRDDPYIIAKDEYGPICERSFELPLYEDARVVITYHGTVDKVWKHIETNEEMVVDHKTTWRIDRQFLTKHKPNFQCAGYLWGAQEAFGIKTDLFMIDGIQVAKGPRKLERIPLYYDVDDIQEWKDAVVHNVHRFLTAIETDKFPITAPAPCALTYSGCQYHQVCSQPCNQRKAILETMYTKGPFT